MILALGARGPGFDSRTGPCFCLLRYWWKKRNFILQIGRRKRIVIYLSFTAWHLWLGPLGAHKSTTLNELNLFSTIHTLCFRQPGRTTFHKSILRPVGLVVWFSLRVREVPGSTPGQALCHCYSKHATNGLFSWLWLENDMTLRKISKPISFKNPFFAWPKRRKKGNSFDHKRVYGLLFSSHTDVH